jgi:hypothetical protein
VSDAADIIAAFVTTHMPSASLGEFRKLYYFTVPLLVFLVFQRSFFFSLFLRTTVQNALGISDVRGMDSLWNEAQWEAFMLLSPVYISSDNHPARPHPQPHPQLQPQPHPQTPLHAMLLPGNKQNKARKYTAKDWDEQRPEIIRLYESNTLNNVVETMRDRHGLDAT